MFAKKCLKRIPKAANGGVTGCPGAGGGGGLRVVIGCLIRAGPREVGVQRGVPESVPPGWS